jgi:hypothetical protein
MCGLSCRISSGHEAVGRSAVGYTVTDSRRATFAALFQNSQAGPGVALPQTGDENQPGSAVTDIARLVSFITTPGYRCPVPSYTFTLYASASPDGGIVLTSPCWLQADPTSATAIASRMTRVFNQEGRRDSSCSCGADPS